MSDQNATEPGATEPSGPAAPPPPAEFDFGSVPSGPRRRRPLAVLRACVLAWLVPGLGHAVLGNKRRGALFAIIIMGLFVGGLALQGKVYRPLEGEPLTYLAALGAAGIGLPFTAAHATGLAEGDLAGRYYEYGNTLTLVAGLLNLLVVLDAYDVGRGRRP